MWNKRKFEYHLESCLKKELQDDKASHLFREYETARDKLIDDIYNEIKGVERNLSDHGPDHVAKVLDISGHLLSDSKSKHGLSAMDLYCLSMAILFHDVGNLFGRVGHHNTKKLGEVFDWARGTDPSVRREKTLVLSAIRAHTGMASDGTFDTLKEVSEYEQLYEEGVKLRSIGAILRFADELAEGPSRTSEYIRTHGGYSEESQIYHDYASVTNIRSDRGTERILLSYEIEIESNNDITSEIRFEKLRNLLDFIYSRIVKLDQERRYAKFYSESLAPFKATQVNLNFHWKGQLLELDLPTLRIEDKVVPGDPTKSISEMDSQYEIESIISSLKDLTQE